jgi:hypothetical protein
VLSKSLASRPSKLPYYAPDEANGKKTINRSEKKIMVSDSEICNIKYENCGDLKRS